MEFGTHPCSHLSHTHQVDLVLDGEVDEVGVHQNLGGGECSRCEYKTGVDEMKLKSMLHLEHPSLPPTHTCQAPLHTHSVPAPLSTRSSLAAQDLPLPERADGGECPPPSLPGPHTPSPLPPACPHLVGGPQLRVVLEEHGGGGLLTESNEEGKARK